METIKKVRKQDSVPGQVKCEAVLAIWTQRRSLAAVCRELGVPWGVVNQWQDRALKAMLGVLEPRQAQPADMAKLPPRLQKLFNRHTDKQGRVLVQPRLEARLDRITQGKNGKKVLIEDQAVKV